MFWLTRIVQIYTCDVIWTPSDNLQYSDNCCDKLTNSHHHVVEGGQSRAQSRPLPRLRGRDQEDGARPQGSLPGRVLCDKPDSPPELLLAFSKCNIRKRSNLRQPVSEPLTLLLNKCDFHLSLVCHEFDFFFSVNPSPLVNPTLERKLPFSISSSSFPQMPFPSDSSSIPQQPSPQNLSSQRKQIYDNPGITRREQPSSTTLTHESQHLMPPPPPPRDLTKKPGVSLESQLMPPPKVIPRGSESGHGSVDQLSSLPDSMRISSRYPSQGPSHHKEDIGKRRQHQPQAIRPAWWSTGPVHICWNESVTLFWRIVNHQLMMVFPSDVCFCIRFTIRETAGHDWLSFLSKLFERVRRPFLSVIFWSFCCEFQANNYYHA